MEIAHSRVEAALTSGNLSEVEAVFAALVLGDSVRVSGGGLMPDQEREVLFEALAGRLTSDERPIPREVAAVLHDLAPLSLNQEPTFANAATIARQNASKLHMGNRRRREPGDLIHEIIAEEGIDSPRLREIGRAQSGVGRGEALDGAPNRGSHVPGGGEGETSSGPPSADDPDAPEPEAGGAAP